MHQEWWLAECSGGDTTSTARRSGNVKELVVCMTIIQPKFVLTYPDWCNFADLVFIQNGMLEPWLAERGLADNTQVMSVTSLRAMYLCRIPNLRNLWGETRLFLKSSYFALQAGTGLFCCCKKGRSADRREDWSQPWGPHSSFWQACTSVCRPSSWARSVLQSESLHDWLQEICTPSSIASWRVTF